MPQNKPKTKTALGPLAGRTFKSPSPAPAASPAPGEDRARRDSPFSTPKKASGFSTPPTSSPSAAAPHHALPPPVLLPRSQETTYHRRLRTLLLEFVKARDTWEDEVISTAEHVGLYCSVLGEIEDEWSEWRKTSKTKSGRRRRATDSDGEEGSGDASGASSSSDSEDAPSSSREGRGGRGLPVQGSLPTDSHRNIGFQSQLLDSLHTLNGVHAKLVRGMTSIQRIQGSITKLKDDALQLESDWIRSGCGPSSGADTQIRWGRRTGSEFVDAVQALALETAMQTQCLAHTLDRNLFTARANPLGSLFAPSHASSRSASISKSAHRASIAAVHDQPDSDSESDSDVSSASNADDSSSSSKKERRNREREPTYSATRASTFRQAALFAWRDLVYVDRSRGIGSFDWWESVWSGEIGRWNGDD